MIIKKKDRIRHENSPECIAFEYPIGDKDINMAFVEIRGRYPDEGYVINESVKELVFVVEGEGKLTIGEKEYGLAEGDAVLILPGEKYFFDGNLKILVPCSPAWFPEQHKFSP
jgi:mannose-6-phosphate isomerase-like protein (cupin superfamily)